MNYDGPGTYQHYKGGQYEALGLGIEEATHAAFVVYRPVSLMMPDDVKTPVDGEQPIFWLRSLEDFNASVTLPAVRDTHPDPVVPRFKKIS